MRSSTRTRSRVRAAALAGALTIGAAGVIGLGVPAIAAAATSPDGATAAREVVTDRLGAIKDALAGLVSDGTITQAQADKVAETLDETLPGPGMGRHMMGGLLAGLDAAAEALDMTPAELRTALRDSSTLAEIAKEKGVATDDVVSALVAAATERIAAAVEDGRLTAERASALEADLEERITTFVEQGGPMGRGPGGMFGGRHHHHHDDETTTDSSEPSESGTTQGSVFGTSA